MSILRIELTSSLKRNKKKNNLSEKAPNNLRIKRVLKFMKIKLMKNIIILKKKSKNWLYSQIFNIFSLEFIMNLLKLKNTIKLLKKSTLNLLNNNTMKLLTKM